MLHKIYLFLAFVLCVSESALYADTKFILVDKVCATVDNERPILLSEVIKKSEIMGVDKKNAQQELLNERALWVAAKKQLKFSPADIKEARNRHIKRIIESNKLTIEEFRNILKTPPYSMSLSQYEYDTDFQILKSQFEASLASSVEISPKEIELESVKRTISSNRFVILFISIAPTKGMTKANVLKFQFNRANAIKREISNVKDLHEIQKKYSGQKELSIVGPLDYEEDSLLPRYDQELKKNPSLKITEPFKDGEAVTMILKEKVLQPDNQETALENVRKELYKRAVQQRLDIVTKNTLTNSSVEINCEW